MSEAADQNFKRATVLISNDTESATATIVGSLIYKCGGLDLSALQQIEERKKTSYVEVLPTLKEIGRAPQVYTPKHLINFSSVRDSSESDCVLVVIHAVETADEACDWIDHLKACSTLIRNKKLVILVDQMNSRDWREQTFLTSVEKATAILTDTTTNEREVSGQVKVEEADKLRERVRFVPVSVNDNLTEPSLNTPWYRKAATGRKDSCSYTVVEAIDWALE